MPIFSKWYGDSGIMKKQATNITGIMPQSMANTRYETNGPMQYAYRRPKLTNSCKKDPRAPLTDVYVIANRMEYRLNAL